MHGIFGTTAICTSIDADWSRILIPPSRKCGYISFSSTKIFWYRSSQLPVTNGRSKSCRLCGLPKNGDRRRSTGFQVLCTMTFNGHPMAQTYRQRRKTTAIQVSEVFDFLRGRSSKLDEEISAKWKGQLTEEFVEKLLRKAKDAESAWLCFNWARKQEFVHTVHTHNRLFDALIGAGKCEEAHRFFKEDWPEEVAPNQYTYHILIRGLCEFRMLEPACDLFEQMKFEGIKPFAVTWKLLIHTLFTDKRAGTAQFYLKLMSNMSAGTSLIYAHCKSGNIEKALALYRETKQKVTPKSWTYTCLIHALVRAKRLVEAEEVLREMAMPTRRNYTAVMGGHCRLGNAPAAYNLLSEMEAKGIPADRFIHNMLLDMHCKTQVVEKVTDLVNEFRGRGWPPDYPLFISQFCSTGRLSDALIVLRTIFNEGEFVPTVICYEVLLDALCKVSKVNEAQNLFKQMLIVGLQPTPSIYYILIHAFYRARRPDGIIPILEQMRSTNLSRNAALYSIMIFGLCTVGKIDEASDALNEIVDDYCEPCYKALIVGLCKADRVTEAYIRLKEMLDRGYSPDTHIYSSVLLCLCRFFRPDEAYEVFLQATERTMGFCEADCNILVDKLCERGSIDQAYNVLQIIRSSGTSPSSFICTTVFEGLCKAAKLAEARQLLEVMGFKPEASTIDTYVRTARSLDEARSLFEEMRRLGSKVGVSVYNILMDGFLKAQRPGDANAVFQEMLLDKGCFPDETRYVELISSHCKLNETHEAYALLKEMTMKWEIQNRTAYNTVLDGFFRAGELKMVHQLLAEMNTDDCTINEETFNILIEGFCRVGQVDRALRVLGEMRKVLTPSTFLKKLLVNELHSAGRSEEAKELSELWDKQQRNL